MVLLTVPGSQTATKDKLGHTVLDSSLDPTLARRGGARL